MIWNNQSLLNLAGFSNITFVESYLIIRNNNALMNIAGLNGITSVGGHLYIEENNSLENIDALSNLISIGGDLKIYRNQVLLTSLACILKDQVLNAGGVGGSIEISENLCDPDCTCY